MKGGKGLLGMGIRKGCAKEKLLVQKKWILKNSKDRFMRIEGLGVVKKRQLLRTARKDLCKRKAVCVKKRRLLRAVRKAFGKWKTFGLRKQAAFSAHAKQPD